jgi:hypothetical protein
MDDPDDALVLAILKILGYGLFAGIAWLVICYVIARR